MLISLEGDHIKVTASKYPFPTVCADNQSTDWFHAISRTLKWNERERQKSFVVVEEGPDAKQRAKQREARKLSSEEEVEEIAEDEEEDETSDNEDDKFDIDSSPDSGAPAPESSPSDSDNRALPHPPLHLGRRSAKSRSRSRSTGLRSGVDSPGRFAGFQHNPPPINHRQIDFNTQVPSPSSSSSSSADSGPIDFVRNGARDDIHLSRKPSNKSRIPRDRDVSELEAARTPTAGTVPHRHRYLRSRSVEHGHHRAFAVWGQDESDSNASDSDV